MDHGFGMERTILVCYGKFILQEQLGSDFSLSKV